MTLIALLAAAGAMQPSEPASLEQTLIAMERESWAAWQRHDVEFWRGFLSEDHLDIHGPGIAGPEQVIAHIGSAICTVTGYELDRFTFRQFDADTALLVYRAAQDTRCGDIRVPSPVWATSLYQRRGGRWLNVLYVHTPIPPPPQARPTP